MEKENNEYKYALIKSILTRRQSLQSMTDQEHWDLFCKYDELEIHELEKLDSLYENECFRQKWQYHLANNKSKII